jgi:hypothetical protein
MIPFGKGDEGVFDEDGVVNLLNNYNFRSDDIERWITNKDKTIVLTGKSLCCAYYLAIEPVIVE